MVPLSSNPCSVAPSTLAHAARMPHSARAAVVRTPMPTTRARQVYAHPPRFLRPGRPPAAVASDGNPAMQASTRPRPHPSRTDTAHTPMHATRNRPTRARARRRSSGGHTGCRSEGCFWARCWYRQALHRVQCRGPRCLRRGERLIVLHLLLLALSRKIFHCFVFLTGHTVR